MGQPRLDNDENPPVKVLSRCPIYTPIFLISSRHFSMEHHPIPARYCGQWDFATDALLALAL